MENLRFDTGVKEFALNGNENAVVRINPTDMNQLKQIYNAVNKISELQETYDKRIDECAEDEHGGLKAIEVLTDMDKMVRGELDALFGLDFCKNAFGNMNLYAYGDGLPVWFNFLEAVILMFDKKLGEIEVARNPRVDKYLSKHGK